MAKAFHNPELGQRFHRLVVTSLPVKRGRLRQVTCRCDCGTVRHVTVCRLYSGDTKSCGCLKGVRARELGAMNKKHGHTAGGRRSPTYMTWQSMLLRCNHPATTSFNRYGGRGICVCDRWSGDGGFDNFLTDMGVRPAGHTLDRIDVDGNYELSNCRWADWPTQVANRDKRRA